MNKKEYPRPAYTADILLFATEETEALQLPRWQTFILLIVRKNEPFKDCWALPGGYVNEGETSIQAARREAEEETGIDLSEEKYGIPEFICISDEPNRDPRGWTVSASYSWHLKKRVKAKAGDDAKEAKWFNIEDLPKNIAFDHINAINKALKTLHN